jgi:hypothetical protein
VQSTGSDVKIENGVQIVNSTLSSGRYPNITVQAGTPVKWMINAPQGSINGCNNRVLIQEYDIEYSFKTGENIIEFTPTKAGKFQYSCWMGMIRGSITVTEAGTAASAGQTSGSSDNDAAGSDPAQGNTADPVPAGYTIPTDKVAIAKEVIDENGDNIQEVTINLSDQGFSPAVVVVQSNLETKWNINNTAAGTENEAKILVPLYSTQIPIQKGENPLLLYPADSFDFSTGDNAFYGYVKVVDDLDQVDIAAVKKEAGEVKTLIWPPDTFQGAGGGGASCH